VIVLADRGFGRTEIARFCQELRFHYVIRIKPDVWVRSRDFTGQTARLSREKRNLPCAELLVPQKAAGRAAGGRALEERLT
jgi:hypothetical protein